MPKPKDPRKVSQFFMARNGTLGKERPLGEIELIADDLVIEAPNDMGNIRITPTPDGVTIEFNSYGPYMAMIKPRAGNVIDIVMVKMLPKP